jgi:ferritin-like metal-binding protein YciE
MQLNSLSDVLVEQLGDLHSAETQLVTALPKAVEAASAPELEKALAAHLEETRGHVRRLEAAFEAIAEPLSHEECEAMKGLIKETDKVLNATGDPAARDAALIASAQRIEHYEISAYGTARELASELGLGSVEELLTATLDEEAEADKKLNKIAKGGMFGLGVNEDAATVGSSRR